MSYSPVQHAQDAAPTWWAWWARNLVRLTGYLLAVAFALSILLTVGVIIEPEKANTASGPERLLLIPITTLVFFLTGGLGSLPGTIVWLLSVAMYPPRWRAWHRRALAVITAPIIGVFWIFLFAGVLRASLLYGVFLPMGAGFVVRLRDRSPSSN